MFRMSLLAACAVLFLSVQPSIAEMDHMKDMDKHMKEHMGGQMQDKGQAQQNGRQMQDSTAITVEAQAEGVTAKVTYSNPG
ncbi:MAG TPA: hypothetical protein VI728_09110, partial [Syntrophales bacterium]|nr:hypothetical protein [Syntrophales bacterium]